MILQDSLSMPTQNLALAAVDPARPVAPYIGGKVRLAKTITQRIADIDHTTYVEPFVGMGGIFFRRQTRPRGEIINDASRDVATLFRILQRHYPQFLDMLKFQVTSRAEFDRLSKTDPDTLTDLERSARFLYLQRLGFGGKVAGRLFGLTTEKARFGLTKVMPMLEDVHERLTGVVIECLPFGECIQRYDRPTTLFYLDPPYHGTDHYYGKDLFSRTDFAKLAEQLHTIKGRFILSINDTDAVRATFAGFDMEEVAVTYSTSGPQRPKAGARPTRQELIISN